jgi:hypothetical protein
VSGWQISVTSEGQSSRFATTTSRQVLEYTQTSFMGSFSGLKWPKREPDHSPRVTADVESSLRGTSLHLLYTSSLFHAWA